MPETAQKHLLDAEDDARLSWARFVFRNRKRTLEGSFNGDTGKYTPSVREGLGDVTPRLPAYFHKWRHVYRLCMAALDGKDVPPDIEASFRSDYPVIHERVMVNAVDEHLKKQSKQHVKAVREAAKAMAKAESQTATARLAERRTQLAGLELKVRRLESKKKALLTRIKRVKRSIGALERSAGK